MSSDVTKAVFLSYASQDAEAARRIAESLRAAGVEVWFDETELRGGDAWDQKLRRQIKECALFVPVISANTQARAEGYFRLEWKLAVDRSHLMADDAPFLFPVVIDDTPDAAARVPEKFRERQWTRLNVKDTPDTLAQRIAAVLSGNGEPTASVASVFRAPAAGARRRSEFPKWLTPVFILVGVGMGLFYTIWPMVKGGGESPPAAVSAQAELSEADKLVEQATAILDGSALSREQIDTANDLLEDAIDRDPSNAAAWTAAARADLLLIYPYGYDESEERRQRAMSRATRAAFLAKDSFETKVVQADVMAHASGNPALTREAEEFFRKMVKERPEDIQLQIRLAETLREQKRFEEAAPIFERAGQFETAAWSWSQADKPALAYEQVKRAVAEHRTTTALVLKENIEIFWFEDLEAAQATIDQLQPSELRAEIIGQAVTRLAFFQRDSEKMLQCLSAFSHDFLDSHGFTGPRQYFTGWAHQLAGRSERAKIEWRKAVTLLQAEREGTSDRVELYNLEAEIHALLGENDEAVRLLETAQRIANQAPDAITDENVRVYLALGRSEPVLSWLTTYLREESQARLQSLHAGARFSPAWDALRDDPRFEALLRETKPPEAKPFGDSNQK